MIIAHPFENIPEQIKLFVGFGTGGKHAAPVGRHHESQHCADCQQPRFTF